MCENNVYKERRNDIGKVENQNSNLQRWLREAQQKRISHGNDAKKESILVAKERIMSEKNEKLIKIIFGKERKREIIKT